MVFIGNAVCTEGRPLILSITMKIQALLFAFTAAALSAQAVRKLLSNLK